MTDAGSDSNGEKIAPINLDNAGYVSDPPKLPGHVVARQHPDDVLTHVASDLLEHSLQCVRKFGDFHMALSGGHTPFPLYERLMTDPLYRGFPWAKTHLWIVDERRVSFDDDLSNWKHIREIFENHSGIPTNQMHPIQATLDDADVLYEKELQEALGWREKGHDRLDYVMLGMGARWPHRQSLSQFVGPGRRRPTHDPEFRTHRGAPGPSEHDLQAAQRVPTHLSAGDGQREGPDDSQDRHRGRSVS